MYDQDNYMAQESRNRVPNPCLLYSFTLMSYYEGQRLIISNDQCLNLLPNKNFETGIILSPIFRIHLPVFLYWVESKIYFSQNENK